MLRTCDGLEEWGPAKHHNFYKTQKSKILQKLTNPPYYVSNKTLNNDLSNSLLVRSGQIPLTQTPQLLLYNSCPA